MLRSVLNSGHYCGGTVTRFIKGESKIYSTFVPVALAAIGKLPFPLMRRSIIIHLERAPHAKLQRFDPRTNPAQEAQIKAVYDVTYAWARQLHTDEALNPDPPMPTALRNRQADNWRVLIAIADAAGSGWGKAARAAAIAMCASVRDEEPGIELLSDIRDIFDGLHVDRISSADLVAALIDDDEMCWCEWRGVRGDQAPHRLTPASMAGLLLPFNILSRTIWPLGRRTSGRGSQKGYLRAQFEAAWASYCREDGTGTQSFKIKCI